VAELLQTLAVDNQGSVPTSFGNGFAAGASGISLRGLGTASTLVLLNGRRIAPYGLADDGQKQFADLNVIPTDAVDRVEVLKDGASAIYGSDAIAGVVNIILRRDYTGNTVRVLARRHRGMGQPADHHRLHQGLRRPRSDRYNGLFSIEYKRFDEIWYRDRADRDWIGRIDLRPWGYSAVEGAGRHRRHHRQRRGRQRHQRQRAQPGSTGDYFNRGNLAHHRLHPHLPRRGLPRTSPATRRATRAAAA
jgi:iron complex outermembrane receptor protein